jgi:hypothetical protein
LAGGILKILAKSGSEPAEKFDINFNPICDNKKRRINQKVY